MQVLKIVKVTPYLDQQEAAINEFLVEGWDLFMVENNDVDGRCVWFVREIVKYGLDTLDPTQFSRGVKPEPIANLG